MKTIVVLQTVSVTALGYVVFRLHLTVQGLRDKVTQLEIRESAKVGPARTYSKRRGGAWRA